MTPVRKLPYYTPHPDHVAVGEWQLVKAGCPTPLPAVLLEWDPAVDILAFTDVEVDVKSVFEECNLRSDVVLQLGASWTSRGTRLSGVGTSVQITAGAQVVEQRLSVSIPGTQLGQSIQLAVHLLVLVPTHGTQAQFVPATAGSRLVTFPYEVTIEGIGPRFPIEVIDFSSTRYPPRASWALFWDPANLHQTVGGDIRLYINRQNAAVVRAVSANRPEDAGIREALRYDIAQQMIFGSLMNREFVESAEVFETGTVGAAVRGMLRVYFSECTIHEVHAMAQRPEVFLPKLQARLEVFWVGGL